MSRQEITIGLFGFGVVGKGLWDVLEKTPGLKANIRRICVKNLDKPRPVPMKHFTFDRHDLLSEPAINVIVELIDDSEAAFEIVSTAMRNGKGVVSANKKMIADHLEDLLELQRECNVPFLYEASCCASIPIIRNLEEYYDNDLLVSLEGIVNGSTNYILTRTSEDRLSYEAALQLAREKGYVETNPTLDVKGFDAKYKLLILLAHAFGIIEKPENIFNLGIQRLGALELNLASEKGHKIKLVAHAQRLENDKVIAFVMPKFVDAKNLLFSVDDVFNGIQTETSFAEKQFFMGRGAGAFPTASAVLSDISALSYNYRYEYKKIAQQDIVLTNEFSLEVFVRFQPKDGIQVTDFISITETYHSSLGNYIVGRISFVKLINSKWAHNPEVSVLQTASSKVEILA